MTILVAALSSARSPSGVCRHAANLARCLLLRNELDHIHLVVGDWQHAYFTDLLDGPNPRIHLTPVDPPNTQLARNIWYATQLPAIARSLQASLVHLAFPAPLLRHRFTCPVVITLHDLYPYDSPANFGYPAVFFNRIILRRALVSADAIACVSASTLQRLQALFPAAAGRRACHIGNCVDPAHLSAPSITPPESLGPAPASQFVLVIAQHRRNKNLPLTLRLFRRALREGLLAPSTRLLIVGNHGPETPALLELLRRDPLLSNAVHLLHGLPEAQLRWCLQHCQFLLATSTTEGFGLPVVEAQLAGRPVVCSRIPAFLEVGGPACYYADLGSSEEDNFMNAIRNATQNQAPSLPFELPHRFTPSHLASRYTALYSRLHCDEAASPTVTPRAIDAHVPAANPRANVLDVQVDAINMEGALARIASLLRFGRKAYICLAGVHGIMEARRNPALAAIYDGAALAAPDGMPTVWVGRLQGHHAMERVAGPDLMIEVMSRPEFRGCTHFLCGGKEGVAEQLRRNLTSRLPALRIVGTFTPPFGPLSVEQEATLLSCVQQSRPDIIWVGISTPKQEQFMAHYLPLLQTRLMFGVGAAFDFHTGRIRDCAPWIKRAGLQWLHRLVQDPRRLWKRYLRNNPAFLFHIALQLSGVRTYRSQLQAAPQTLAPAWKESGSHHP